MDLLLKSTVIQKGYQDILLDAEIAFFQENVAVRRLAKTVSLINEGHMK